MLTKTSVSDDVAEESDLPAASKLKHCTLDSSLYFLIFRVFYTKYQKHSHLSKLLYSFPYS